MTRYVVRRLLYLGLVMLGASTIVFAVVRVLPGDPAMMIAGDYAGPEELAQLREHMGLDRPLYEQYVRWLYELLQGNFGRSLRNRELIIVELAARAPATIELALVSLIIGVSLGLLLGVLAATHHLSWLDHFVMLISLVGTAVPVFWTGLLLVMVFSVGLGWLPVGGRISVTAAASEPTGFYILDGVLAGNPALVWDALKHLLLPAIALSWYPLATVARVTRSSLLEVLGQDFIRTAHAKGLSPNPVLLRHALRNALIPVITVIGISVGPLVGGAVLTETVFSWPGLGRYLVLTIFNRDFPAVQAIVFLSAFGFAAVNLVVDLAYGWIDPRIRYGE